MDIRRYFNVVKQPVNFFKISNDINNDISIDNVSKDNVSKDNVSSEKFSCLQSSDIIVYTDGSAINNGKKNCYGGIGVFFGDNDLRNISERLPDGKASNNVAELTACLRAIEIIVNDNYNNSKIIICTDSEYMINCITVWCHSWQKNNWQRNVKGKNKPIKNLEIIRKIKSYVDKYKIIFKHIRSHKTPPKDTSSLEYKDWYGNDMADNLAKQGAEIKL